MEKTESKSRFAILAGLILISILIRFWQYMNSPPPAVNLGSYIASVGLGLFLIPLIYKLAKRITRSTEAGLFAAALVTALPLYSWKTVGQLSHTLAVCFFFFSALSFIFLKEIGDWKPAIIVPIAFAFVHIYSLLLIPVIAFYMIFVKLEQKTLSRNELTFAILSSLSITGIFFFFTATPALFLTIQKYIVTNYYTVAAENFTLAKVFELAGTLPIYLGFLGAYYGLREKRKSVLFFLSAVLVMFLVMLFNIVPALLGLPYFSLALACLAGFSYTALAKHLKISRFKAYEKHIKIAFFIIVLLLSAAHGLLAT